MSVAYGWIEDPRPVGWPAWCEFARGEVVRIRNVPTLEGAEGVVAGYDDRASPPFRYYVNIPGQDTSWVLTKEYLQSTGVVEPGRLPKRIIPVLGDGTLVRLRDGDETRRQGIAGKLAFTAGLWWTDSEEPDGYVVQLVGEEQVRLVPFGSFEVVTGAG